MLGFELEIKGQIIGASMGNRCVSIIVTKKNGRFTIKFSGSDFTINESMTWYESELEIGDKMTITIKNIENESAPIMIENIEVNSCSQENHVKIMKEVEKREFEELRQLLIQRGVALPV